MIRIISGPQDITESYPHLRWIALSCGQDWDLQYASFEAAVLAQLHRLSAASLQALRIEIADFMSEIKGVLAREPQPLTPWLTLGGSAWYEDLSLEDGLRRVLSLVDEMLLRSK